MPTLKHEKSLDAGTPVSGGGKVGGKKRVWRKRRRQSNSNSKEEKMKDSGFLEKIQNSDRLTRRQSLPPLTNLLTSQLSQHSGMDHTPSSPALLDESVIGGVEGEGVVSRDSTPRPKHPETPITPNGSFSPEVSELIESLKHPSRHHRRNGSNGSQRIMTHRRQGSNGSVTSGRGLSLEATPLRSPNPISASSSKRASVELSTSRRGSGSGVPYSRMDTFSSMSDSENAEPSILDSSAKSPSTSGVHHVPVPRSLPLGGADTRRGGVQKSSPQREVTMTTTDI